MNIFIGTKKVRVFEGSVEAENSPHVFVDRQIIAVNIADAFMDGVDEAIVYSPCEVYSPRGVMAKVCIVSFFVFSIFYVDGLCVVIPNMISIFFKVLFSPLIISLFESINSIITIYYYHYFQMELKNSSRTWILVIPP